MSSVSAESHVELGGYGCVSILGSSSFTSVLAAGHSRLIGRQFLPMLSSIPGFCIGMIIALCHISGICPVEIDRLKIVDGTLSEFLEAEGADPVWSDGCGRFGQSDSFFCVGRRDGRRSC